ncbi:hypothetical protein TNCV_3090851 [Trichonephila clavipes]|uniref:Cytochrome P450 n=1 Tax=Trichonephila clavipes TaxID=2585209 RepID=A0A8X6W8Z0_TRICX|nr:hypothetical protein TNCV_3090851 [Trichonephila clavipes]
MMRQNNARGSYNIPLFREKAENSITSPVYMQTCKLQAKCELSEIEVLAQCVLFFMVGYETTATVLTYVAYCLATNPEWQEKLIQEVDEAFEKHTEMSYDAVRDMKILDAVVSETLRKHPPLLLFMDGFEPKHPQYAYLPFGAGPRNCLGMRFALLEIKLCITNILRHFRIKPLPTTKVRQCVTFNFKKLLLK